jgi:hypothetical protein
LELIISGKGTTMKSQEGMINRLTLFGTFVVLAFTTMMILGTVGWSASYPTSTVPPTMFVPVDVEPGYCPNPFKVYDSGDICVAILGTDRFDVTHVVPDSIRLLEIAPVRSEQRDIATPYRLYRWWTRGKHLEADNCTDQGPDGKLDLVLYFNKEDILKAVGSTRSGDLLILRITGRHTSGAQLSGQDVAVIE